MSQVVLFGPPRPAVADDTSSPEFSPTSSRSSSDSPRTVSSTTFEHTPHQQERRASEADSSKTEEDSDVPNSPAIKADPADEDGESGLVVLSPGSRQLVAARRSQAGRRPRGRPRKHPKPEPSPQEKAPKGRSKTGCVTCRRRKKKCDERKPTCMHCEKNNVHCEGYPPREFWQSGKQKAVSKTQQRWALQGPHPLPSIIQGLDTDLDWFIFDHFNSRLSKVLSLLRDGKNPFQEILLPMATTHRGLMHSLLSLSGAHLLIRGDNSAGDSLESRSAYHFGEAIKHLQRDKAMQKKWKGDQSTQLDDPTIAQVVLLCLKTICEGDTAGVYLFHLNAVETMLKSHRVVNQEFSSFLYEFFIFHDMSNAMTSKHKTTIMSDDFVLPKFISPTAGVFLGVCDGLFGSTSKIRQLRDRIRERREKQIRPYVDFHTILDGKVIDAELKSRQCSYDRGTDEWLSWQLYRTCFWLYLHRTLNTSCDNEGLHDAVQEAVEYLEAIPSDSPVQSVLLTPIFIVGCAAFDAKFRQPILDALDVIEKYSELGNIRHARSIVQRVWELMDLDDEQTWDWEGIMDDMGLRLLIT